MKKLIVQVVLICIVPLLINCEKGQTNDSWKVLRSYESAIVDGITRTYLVNLPHNYDENKVFPLVIALHGAGGSANQFEHDYQFTSFANDNHFIVVYPEGVKNDRILGLRTWNAGTCCDYASESNIDDVGFIRELIDRLEAKYKIDSNRIYATGMSNGGMMTYRLASELSDKIAAFAVVSGTMFISEPANPSRPVPILHIHSVLDTKVPSQGGVGLAGYYYPPVDSVLNVWSLVNGCDTKPEIIEDNQGYTLTEWSNCENNTVIKYYLTKDGGHTWPGGLKARALADEPSKAVNANQLIWNFFQQYELQ